MAIERLVFCLTSLVILTTRMTSTLPQGMMSNFGWPVQQEFVQRLPAPTFMSNEQAVSPALSLPSSFQTTPEVPAAPKKQVATLAPQRKLFKQPVSESPQRKLTKKPSTESQQRDLTVGSSRSVQLEDHLNETIGANRTVENSSKSSEIVEKSSNGLNYLENLLANPARLVPTGVALFGAVLGRDGCELKAACLAGSLVPSVQGRELFVSAAETIVPSNWKQVYQAAKSSIIQGQDCSQFSCF